MTYLSFCRSDPGRPELVLLTHIPPALLYRHLVSAPCSTIIPVPELLFMLSEAPSTRHLSDLWPHIVWPQGSAEHTLFPDLSNLLHWPLFDLKCRGLRTSLIIVPTLSLSHVQHCSIWFYLKYSSHGVISLFIYLPIFQCDFLVNVRSMNSGTLSCPCCILSAQNKPYLAHRRLICGWIISANIGSSTGNMTFVFRIF